MELEKSKRTDYWREQKRKKRAENKKKALQEAVVEAKKRSQDLSLGAITTETMKIEHIKAVSILSRERFFNE